MKILSFGRIAVASFIFFSVVIIYLVFQNHAFVQNAQGWFRERLKLKEALQYEGILADCRLLATNVCISYLTDQGKQKYADQARQTPFTATDINFVRVPRYPRERLTVFFEKLLSAVPRADIPHVVTATGSSVPYYEEVINVSLQNNINPELVITLMQMTTGTTDGNFSKYPSILDLRQQSVAQEVGLLTSTLKQAYTQYATLVVTQNYRKLKQRFSAYSIEKAQALNDLNASSFAYLETIYDLYKDKPYYQDLIDMRFQNPTSFRNVYFHYNLSDPRANRQLP